MAVKEQNYLKMNVGNEINTFERLLGEERRVMRT